MTEHENGAWHSEVISASTETTLCVLRDANLLNNAYLAGGTGLALPPGTRAKLI